MRRPAELFVMLALGLAAAGCGSSGPTTAGTPTTTTAPATAATTTAAGSDTGGCPLAAEDLSAATGMAFELATTEPDRALETLETVKAMVCVFSSADEPQPGGDRLGLRVDTVTGADAATVTAEFERSCTSNGGTLNDVTADDDAQTCTSRGSTIEGNIDTGDRTVNVYFVNADEATAAALTPNFDKVLDAVD
ncbi:hypothetical protein [Pseudonocardia sp.]|jgi:hypothetical protein|uniref:hypothetical protein n=1 Tax=Pseudonocardia sp. TaxID=60912 RepID=UPI00262F01C4|nr:hypothetical protein [Pseudonocardia sp.]